MVAGERPSGLGRRGRSAGWLIKRVVVIVLILAIVIPVVGYFVDQGFHDRVNSLIGQGGNNVLLLQHPSGDATDSKPSTYWLVDLSTGNARVTTGYKGTVDLAQVSFNSGAPDPDTATYGRPREVAITIPGDSTYTVTLADSSAVQAYCLPHHDLVSEFTIQILSSYAPADPTQKLVALRDVIGQTGACSKEAIPLTR